MKELFMIGDQVVITEDALFYEKGETGIITRVYDEFDFVSQTYDVKFSEEWGDIAAVPEDRLERIIKE